MKHNARKLLAVILALAMLLSTFAMAEDGMTELGMDQPIEIEGELGGEGEDAPQTPEGEIEIEPEEGGDAPEGDLDLAVGEDLALDLDGESLETFEEALAPVTEAAMNTVSGSGTKSDPKVVTTWDELNNELSGAKPADETDKTPPITSWQMMSLLHLHKVPSRWPRAAMSCRT